MLICIASSVAQAEAELRKSARVGVMADVGLPDGAMASLVYRPISALRVHAGIGHNYVSKGVRGGLTFVPFRTWLTPTLSVDYGRYFEGDANPLARMLSGDASYSSPYLEHVGYDYANGHIGIQFGRERATFYIAGGVTRVTSDVRAFWPTSTFPV